MNSINIININLYNNTIHKFQSMLDILVTIFHFLNY